MRAIFPAGSQGLGDAELISATRTGDAEAYAELTLRHRDAAHRLARQLVPVDRVDELVADACTRVQVVLQRGDGPDLAFRPYLLTAVRRLHVNHSPIPRRADAPEDVVAARAFTSLPEPWRMALWHTEVDGASAGEIAALMGEPTESMPALISRAREGMRMALLALNEPTSDEDCDWTRHHLGAYVRKVSYDRDTARIEHHLPTCERCSAICRELTEGSVNLRSVLAPLVLGGVAPGYLATLPTKRPRARSGAAAGSSDRQGARLSLGLIGGVLAIFVGIGSGVAGGVSAATTRIGGRFGGAKDFATQRAGAAALAGVATLALTAGGVFVVVQAADGPLEASAETPADVVLDDDPSVPADPQDDPNVIGIGDATSRGPGKQASKDPSESPSASPSDDSSESASASPSDDPSTSDRPSPDPNDTTDPSDEPTPPAQPTRPPSQQPSEPPSQEPTPVSDLAVSASTSDLLGLWWGIDVRVTGLAAGETATLSVLSSNGSDSRLNLDSKCTSNGNGGATCRVTETPSTYRFNAQGSSDGRRTTFTFLVSPDNGSDADWSNNSASVSIRS